MSITPLDLQTLFVRLNEVGKEQNHLKEAVASQQAAGAKQIKDNEIKQDNSVNRTEEGKDAQKLKDEERKEQQKHDDLEKEKENETASPKKNVYNDPEMGSHIDISG